MRLNTFTIAKTLSPALKASKPSRNEFEQFKVGLGRYFARLNHNESEENLKTHLMDLLKGHYGTGHHVEQQGQIDFVIRSGGSATNAAVLFEHKRSANRAEMITTENCNKKALHELVMHFMRERSNGNTSIRNLVICTEHDFFIFEAKTFERMFFKSTTFRSSFENWAAGRATDQTTDFFYNQIAQPFIDRLDEDVDVVHFTFGSIQGQNLDDLPDKVLLPFFKIFSPQHLLRVDLKNNSNSLNKSFYDELLHIVGLKEDKGGTAKVIGRLPITERNPASLIENTIAQLTIEDEFNSPEIIETYGTNIDRRAFSIALELSLTWVNRLLFLKLLEGQLVKFHQGDKAYRFLNPSMIGDYDDLRDLFFKVLAFQSPERHPDIQAKYGLVPYLNSSLFEKTELERLIGIHSLNAGISMPYFRRTVLRDGAGRRLTGDSQTLEYLFAFLDAYDFGAIGGGDIREDSKTIINAAVLGLIFEKINGYKEGAIFTPGYVTMYMSRKVIEKTVLEAFINQNPTWQISNISDLKNYLADRRSQADILASNAVIDNLKICDPAVGSGHFLVSCLNEMIALKFRLGILSDAEGNRITDYIVEVDNDELIILKADNDELFVYQIANGNVPPRLQQMQKTIFHEKQKLIENCLFGVDINPNSVRICQLRLWIELLKSAYYRDGDNGDLETLPNIDINIKCGNSLLSRFKLDANLSVAFNRAGLTVTEYRQLVADYKNTKDKTVKRELLERIDRAKGTFQNEAICDLTAKIDLKIDRLAQRQAQAELLPLNEDEKKAQDGKIFLIRNSLQDLKIRREKALQRQTFLSALEWRFEFPEVLDDRGQFRGFDIIIANPPYMRVQEIEKTQPEQKIFYENAFSTARGSYDLANLFFELAGTLSNAAGHNNIFILPHKLFNSANGEALREYLMNTRALKHLTHFGANQIFDSAITYTCIAMFNTERSEIFRFQRFPLGADYETRLNSDMSLVDLSYEDVSAASALYGGNQWIFFDQPEGYNTLRKAYAQTSKVSEKFEDVFQGIATSKDALYIGRKINETAEHYIIQINPEQRSEQPPIATHEFQVEKTFFRPFLMGRDVHRYETLHTDRLVFFPYQIQRAQAELVRIAELQRDYPLTHAFIIEYENAFSAREKGRPRNLDEWYAYIYPKNLTKFDQDKLTSMEICSNHPNIAIDRDAIYHATTLYSLVVNNTTTESYEFFAGVLNSDLFWWFLKVTGDTLQGDARRMKTNYINPFPLPEIVSEANELEISRLVTRLISAKAPDGDPAQIETLEAQINTAVYNLYGFDDDDIAVVAATLNPDLALI